MDSETRLRELAAIRRNLVEGRATPPITVRDLLEWFNAKRRGFWVVAQITAELSDHSLTTVPDFESVWIGAQVTFALVHTPAEHSDDSLSSTDSDSMPKVVIAEVPTWISRDPTYRVGRLQAARQNFSSIPPTGTLTEAVTILLSRGVAQLPVMTNERDVKGVITWRSIGTTVALRGTAILAKDVMNPHREVRVDSSIFEAIPIIVEDGHVLIRDNENKISGILTSSDLSLQFQKLTEPFLLLSEIENLVRNMIGSKFSKAELAAARDPSDPNRAIEDVNDMTFGEYIRLLQSPERWSQLNLAIDRKIFCDNLDRVRAIRNGVTHFDPDGITDEELFQLREFANFLKQLATISIRVA